MWPHRLLLIAIGFHRLACCIPSCEYIVLSCKFVTLVLIREGGRKGGSRRGRFDCILFSHFTPYSYKVKSPFCMMCTKINCRQLALMKEILVCNKWSSLICNSWFVCTVHVHSDALHIYNVTWIGLVGFKVTCMLLFAFKVLPENLLPGAYIVLVKADEGLTKVLVRTEIMAIQNIITARTL